MQALLLQWPIAEGWRAYLAAIVASPATGRAGFSGHIGWGPDTSSSGGTLTVERMDFVSPMGPVVGLTGQVAFTSLIPPTAAPGRFSPPPGAAPSSTRCAPAPPGSTKRR